MRKLVVLKKTGYRITDPNQPVIIRDNRGLLFYTTETLLNRHDKPNPTQFNLPAFGTYWVEHGSFVPMDAPVKYKYSPVPDLIPRYPDDPKTFNIVWGNNPNKCTIKWGQKIILFDKAFEERPLPEVFFILYHEYGHRYFSQENLCDLMAANYMKAKGFNPSQIGAAPVTALSERQIVRKNELVNHIIGSL